MDFTGKRVLVTAGPTWTKVDRVRVLTSIFSGETGLRFARHFADLGANVTLFMGPGRAKFEAKDWERMRVEQFWYYQELADLLDTTLANESFDIILHSSAVSDYDPIKAYDGKLPSGQDDMTISLEPTKKLVDKMRVDAPNAFLVKFKLQVGLTKDELLGIAKKSLAHSKADLIVANDLDYMDGEDHVAFIVDPQDGVVEARTKAEMCDKLAAAVAQRMVNA